MDNATNDDRAAGFAGRTGAAADAFAGDVRKKVEDVASKAGPAAAQAYDQAREQVRGAATTLASSVETQPLTALLVAGLACGVLGFLLARR